MSSRKMPVVSCSHRNKEYFFSWCYLLGARLWVSRLPFEVSFLIGRMGLKKPTYLMGLL